MAQNAAEKTFAIPELCERILLHLESYQLLVDIPRVCKSINATFNGSKKLQEKALFRPINSHATTRSHSNATACGHPKPVHFSLPDSGSKTGWAYFTIEAGEDWVFNCPPWRTAEYFILHRKTAAPGSIRIEDNSSMHRARFADDDVRVSVTVMQTAAGTHADILRKGRLNQDVTIVELLQWIILASRRQVKGGEGIWDGGWDDLFDR